MSDWDGLIVYLEELRKTVEQAHGVADRLNSVRKLLAEAKLSSGTLGSSDAAEAVLDAWNKDLEQRRADARKLRENTASLAYKIEWTVQCFAGTEDRNRKDFKNIASQIRDDLLEGHLRRGRHGDDPSSREFGGWQGGYEPDPKKGPVGDPGKGPEKPGPNGELY